MSDTERDSDRARPLLLFPDQPHTPEPLSASVSGADSDKSDRMLLSQRTSSTPVEAMSASGPASPSTEENFARERNDPHSASFSELSGVSEVYEQLPGSSQPEETNPQQPQRIKVSSRASGPSNGDRPAASAGSSADPRPLLQAKDAPAVKVDRLGDDEDLVNVDRSRDFDNLIQNQVQLRTIWGKIQSIRTAQALVFAYVYAETRRSKRAFAIGCFTVLLVVCFVSLLQNAISSSPLIFLKLSENSVGEMDLIMTPGFSVSGSTYIKSDVSGLPLLNNSYIDSRVGNSDDLVEGVSPRWVLLGDLSSQVSTKDVSAIIFAYNSEQEEKIGLGRDWKFPTLKSDECYVSRTIVLQTGLDLDTAVGKPITATINLVELLNAAGVLDTDTNQINSNDLLGIIETFYPNITDVWNTNFTVSVGQLFNVSSIDVSVLLDFVSPQNLTRILIDLENTLQPFTTVQLPDATVLENVTDAEYASAAQGIVNQLLLPNITLSLTFGDLVELALPTLSQNLVLSRSFSIAGVVDDPKGKWPTALGSVMALEEAAFSQVIKDSVLAFASVFTNLSDITIPVTPQFSLTVSLFQVIETLPGISAAQRQTLIDALNTYEDRTAYFNSPEFKDFVRDVNLEDYAFTSIAMFKDRLQAYTADLITMNKEIIKFTDRIAAKIGFSYPATFSVPLKNALAASMYARYFLDNIFGSVVALVVVLGIMLIYALMLNDIEGKTYEYGMLRALGMKNLTLIQLLITKSLVFAIPGIGIGLFVAFLGNMGVQSQIAAFTALPQSYTLYDVAVLLALSLGLLIPLIANVVPISRALSKTLRDSLDIYHHVISEVQVTVTRLANMGLDLWLTCLSVLTILMGFVVFYIVPYAFTFGKFDIFLGILNGILLGMLVGLCILAMAIQPYLEKLIVWLMLWGNHRRLIRVVRKNLSGHRNRNRKTSQMFTLCLAFVIFAGAMFALQSRNIEDNVKVLFGADILVTAPSEKVALQETEISAYLDDQIRLRNQGDPNGVVEDYAYITFDLRRDEAVDYFRVSSLPMFPSVRQAIYGVQQNHLAVTYNSYYVVNDYRGNNFPSIGGKKDVIGGMYVDAGNARLPEESNGIVVAASIGSGVYEDSSGTVPYNGSNDNIFARPSYRDAYVNYLDVVVGSALTPFASIDLDIPMQFVVGANDPVKGWHYDYYLAKPRGIVSKVPAFFFSSYQSAVRLGAVLIRMDEWYRLAQAARQWKNISMPATAPKQRLLVRCKSGASDKQRQDVINGLGAFFQSNNITATDTLSTIESAQRSFALLSLFFNVVGAIAMLMCFFILWLSFTANVQEHAWEFGVLRSLGVSAFQTLMIYVYESLAIVLASVLLGTAIGLAIAISLTLQFNLFVEMPFNFEFPWTLFFTMFFMALAVAIGGSGIPAYSFTKKTISNVLRRN